MSQIIELIKKHDWKGIFNYVEYLGDNDRIELQKELTVVDYQKLDSDNGADLEGEARTKFYNIRQKNADALEYAKLVSIRSYDELKESFPNDVWRIYFGPSDKSPNSLEQKIEFFTKYPPNYLDRIIKENNFNSIEFRLLWKLFENGWVKFDEEFFVNSLFYVQMFSRDTVQDADFLMENPEAIEKVLLQFYKYEIDILDISKWESREGFQCTKINNFWTEVFTILLEKDVAINRDLIAHLLESLLNHWKKPHLNWHVQLIKLLKPTVDEYLQNQNLLFSVLSSENNTIVNYVVGVLGTIHKSAKFDFTTYAESVAVIFVNEKVDKSLIKSLKIIDHGVSKNEGLKQAIVEQLCLGLTSAKTEIQSEFASRIAKYCEPEKLQELVLPYTSYLKSKSKEILKVEKGEVAEVVQLTAHESEITELVFPKNWEELLEFISKTIRSKSPTDIEVLLESIIQLNDQRPPNYQKQLGSYKKQMSREWWDSLMRSFSDFFRNWVNDSDAFQLENFNMNPTRLPFLTGKMIETFDRLKSMNKLPYLSTPTHTPCYIHPEVLVDRLLAYEKAKSEVNWMDLTIACNRILKDIPVDSFVEKANSLKGDYAKAVNYLVGNSDSIELTNASEKTKKEAENQELLNLWAQIARTRNVDGIYNEFKGTSLEGLESVIRPLDLDFEIEKSTSDNYTWYSLNLDKKWNSMGGDYKDLNNYLYSSSFHLTEQDHDMYYQASLVINYIDPLLCSHVFFYCNTEGIHSAPLKYILDNNIKVHHSGWIYIAACLLTNGKEVRSMAEEYIVFALANKFMKETYFSEIVAKLIVEKFMPVKRLTDYIERSFAIKELKELHFSILTKCIEAVDVNDKPRSFPKIVSLFIELQKDLNGQTSDLIQAKIKSLKR
jgi:hypothetical protein